MLRRNLRMCAVHRQRRLNPHNPLLLDCVPRAGQFSAMSLPSRRSATQVLGSVIAGAVSIGALLAIANPIPPVRLGLTILLPIAVGMAFFGSWQEGSCPKCRARARMQERTDLTPTVEAASHADASGGAVDISLGWQVTLSHTLSCQACGHRYSSSDDVFITRDQARTPSEAVVLAQSRIDSLEGP